jgi:beta-ketoacyl synthase-like protein
MQVVIRSIGVIGPGLPDWATASAVLGGARGYERAPVTLSAVDALPAAERRRTGPPIRLALSTGLQALNTGRLDAADVATVFTSSGGDGQVIHDICEALATQTREVSPTRFHNSVHNAPAGYWGIATRAHTPSTSLCAFDWSFGAGLLEACAQVLGGTLPVLLVSYDLPYPPPLLQARPVEGVLGIALLIDRAGSGSGLAHLNVELTQKPGALSTMRDTQLEQLRQNNPTGRALPLLAAIAQGRSSELRLEYLDAALAVHVRPAQ